MQGAQDSLWNGDSRPLMRKPESWLRAPTFRGGFTLDLSGAELFCALGAVAVFDAGFIAVLALWQSCPSFCDRPGLILLSGIFG